MEMLMAIAVTLVFTLASLLTLERTGCICTADD